MHYQIQSDLLLTRFIMKVKLCLFVLVLCLSREVADCPFGLLRLILPEKQSNH